MAASLELLNAAQAAQLASPPVFQAFQASNQSVPTGFTGLAATLGTPAIDSYSGWSSGSPTRYTPQISGWYLVIGQFAFAVNTTGTRLLQVQKNGSGTSSPAATGSTPSSSYNAVLNASGLYFLNGTTDYIECWGFQDSGGALNSVATATSLTALRIHV
jgi:hypothetical protein